MKNYSKKVLNDALNDLYNTRDFFLSHQNENAADEVRIHIRDVEKQLYLLGTSERNKNIKFMYDNYVSTNKICYFFDITLDELYKIVKETRPNKNSKDYLSFLKQELKKLQQIIDDKEDIFKKRNSVIKSISQWN